MSPDSQLRVQDVDLSGVKGKSVTTRVKQGDDSMTFIAVLATYNGTGYAMFFHCDSRLFQTYSPIMSHVVSSIKFSKYASKLVTLHPFIVKSANIIIRYPEGYEVIKKGLY